MANLCVLSCLCGKKHYYQVHSNFVSISFAPLYVYRTCQTCVLTVRMYFVIDARIMPYYPHQWDHVEGAAHFEVSPEAGLRMFAELRRRLPGYAVPLYVREISGKACKEVIAE